MARGQDLKTYDEKELGRDRREGAGMRRGKEGEERKGEGKRGGGGWGKRVKGKVPSKKGGRAKGN